jgi:hypothetical protein
MACFGHFFFGSLGFVLDFGFSPDPYAPSIATVLLAYTFPVELQPLESRRLFASVTLITHGYEPTGVASPWISFLGSAMAARFPSGADVYRMTISGTGANAKVASFVPVSTASSAPRADAVVLLDWAASSSVNFATLSASTSSTQIAQLVAPELLAAQSNFGPRTTPLGELPVHLIGHSRGASVVSELAKALGQRGLWVDQVTTLDPRPVPPDPDVRAWSNVLFADNYYEQTDSSIILDGSAVTGAANVNLSSAFSNLTGLGQAHNAVPIYYGGTANTGASSFAGTGIDSGWYASPLPGRGVTGVAYSEGLGGSGAVARPLDGLRFAGGASRSGVSVSASGAERWDNINVTAPAGPTSVPQGAGVNVSFRFEDVNGDATTSYYLDTDTSPYDGLGVPAPLTSGPPSASSSGATAYQTTLSTASLPVGNYYLAAKIESAAHTRYDYSLFPITVLPAGTTVPTQVLSFTRAKPLSYLDADNHRVTLRLSGPGTGTLTLPTSDPLPGNSRTLLRATGAASLAVAGTTARSSVSIVTPARTTTRFSTITINDALSGVSAPTTDLQDALTAQSSLRSLALHDLSGATVTLAQGVTTAVLNATTHAKVLAGFSPESTVSSYNLVNPAAVFKTLTVRGAFSDTLVAAPKLPVTRLTVLDAARPSTFLAQTPPTGRTIFVKGKPQNPGELPAGLELRQIVQGT